MQHRHVAQLELSGSLHPLPPHPDDTLGLTFSPAISMPRVQSTHWGWSPERASAAALERPGSAKLEPLDAAKVREVHGAVRSAVGITRRPLSPSHGRRPLSASHERQLLRQQLQLQESKVAAGGGGRQHWSSSRGRNPRRRSFKRATTAGSGGETWAGLEGRPGSASAIYRVSSAADLGGSGRGGKGRPAPLVRGKELTSREIEESVAIILDSGKVDPAAAGEEEELPQSRAASLVPAAYPSPAVTPTREPAALEPMPLEELSPPLKQPLLPLHWSTHELIERAAAEKSSSQRAAALSTYREAEAVLDQREAKIFCIQQMRLLIDEIAAQQCHEQNAREEGEKQQRWERLSAGIPSRSPSPTKGKGGRRGRSSFRLSTNEGALPQRDFEGRLPRPKSAASFSAQLQSLLNTSMPDMVAIKLTEGARTAMREHRPECRCSRCLWEQKNAKLLF